MVLSEINEIKSDLRSADTATLHVGELVDQFHREYGKKPRVFSAPGRVNLIGEHRLQRWIRAAFAAQAAEHNYVDTQCGIMDQFAATMVRERHAMLIDCRSLEVDYIPINLPEIILVVCNTNVNMASPVPLTISGDRSVNLR